MTKQFGLPLRRLWGRERLAEHQSFHARLKNVQESTLLSVERVPAAVPGISDGEFGAVPKPLEAVPLGVRDLADKVLSPGDAELVVAVINPLALIKDIAHASHSLSFAGNPASA